MRLSAPECATAGCIKQLSHKGRLMLFVRSYPTVSEQRSDVHEDGNRPTREPHVSLDVDRSESNDDPKETRLRHITLPI